MRPVGIVAPLRLEARSLGRLRTHPGIRLRVSGMGARAAADAAAELAGEGVRGLVSWGLAAGLSAEIEPGTLVLATGVIDEEARLETSRAWREDFAQALSRAGLRVRTGGVYHLDAPACSPEEKGMLGAASGALAADMESAAVARVAADHGLDFLVVRAVVDAVGERVPRAALAGVEGARVRPLRLAAALLKYPTDWPSMARLAGNARRAGRTLRRAAEGFVFPPDPV